MNHDTISTRLDVKETSLIEPDAQKIPVASLVWEKMAATVSIIIGTLSPTQTQHTAEAVFRCYYYSNVFTFVSSATFKVEVEPMPQLSDGVNTPNTQRAKFRLFLQCFECHYTTMRRHHFVVTGFL